MANKDFYKYAKAYDLAFSDRWIDVECDFLEWCFNNHSNVQNVRAQKSFAELGCGPARHAREMARRGWESTVLDISEDMINYACSEAKKEKVKLKPVLADMSDFNLGKPVVLTATLMESISHLVTNEQMISHFKSVTRNSVSGALYVIEATHPMFFFPEDEPNSWVEKFGNTEIEITFGMPTDIYNSITQQWLLTTKLKIKEGNKPEVVIESKNPIRWYLAQEMKVLIELADVFDKYWFYGSLYSIPPNDLDESEDSDAMVIVLRVK
ncbi:class I SAM-dependent methyltransferase [Bacteroidota bacterium]